MTSYESDFKIFLRSCEIDDWFGYMVHEKDSSTSCYLCYKQAENRFVIKGLSEISMDELISLLRKVRDRSNGYPDKRITDIINRYKSSNSDIANHDVRMNIWKLLTHINKVFPRKLYKMEVYLDLDRQIKNINKYKYNI